MRRLSTIRVSITKHQRKFVNAQINSGRYASANEVVSAALRLLRERQKVQAAYWADVAAKAALGETQMEHGMSVDGDSAMDALEQTVLRRKPDRSSGRRPW